MREDRNEFFKTIGLPFTIIGTMLTLADVVLGLLQWLSIGIVVIVLIFIFLLTVIWFQYRQNKKMSFVIENLSNENSNLQEQLDPRHYKTHYYEYRYSEIEFYGVGNKGYLSAKRRIDMKLIATETKRAWSQVLTKRSSQDTKFKDADINILKMYRSRHSTDTIQSGFKFKDEKLSYQVKFNPALEPGEEFCFQAEFDIPNNSAATSTVLAKRGDVDDPGVRGGKEFVSSVVSYYVNDFKFTVLMPKKFKTTKHDIEAVMRNQHHNDEEATIQNERLFTINEDTDNWVLCLERKEPPVALNKGITYRITWMPPEKLRLE